jgi:hypothetical protein
LLGIFVWDDADGVVALAVLVDLARVPINSGVQICSVERLTPWAGGKGRRMGCLLALLAGFAPRVALALVWIFTNWVDRAFNGFLIPLLGLIVFPYATLFYVLAYSPVSGGVGGWGWIFVVLGFVFDIGHWVGGGVTGRQRYASA